MTKKKDGSKRFQGTFRLLDGMDSFGELSVKGRKTMLKLSSQSELPLLGITGDVQGTTLDGNKITCIDCIGSSQGRTTKREVNTFHYAHIFPHYVVVGDEHVDSESKCIRRVSFTTNDMSSIFYDFDAFGFVIHASDVIDAVLEQQSKIRKIEAGEWPDVAYFTGKFTIVEVDTAIGRVNVRHRPASNMGGPDGFYMKNRIYISVEPSTPITFDEAIDRVACLSRFLSMAAGREQGALDIHIATTHVSDEEHPSPLRVHWSYAPKGARPGDSQDRPHPGDVPLDPVRRRDEFATVIVDWIARDAGWRIARNRYLNCLRKGNSYGVDRLVAAANMFDVLPLEATPVPKELSADLAEAQSVFLTAFRKLPQSQDRDSAISAIARMGKPSLPKKVMYRAQIVDQKIGDRFNELAYVLKLAIACRNHFVHGGSDNFNFDAAEPFVGFLTDALEFVFAASDFIEAGWDAAKWSQEAHGNGHSFARFRWGYRETLSQLKQAMED